MGLPWTGPEILHPIFKWRHPLPFAICFQLNFVCWMCEQKRGKNVASAGLSELWSFPHLTKSYLLQVRVSEKNRTNTGCVCVCVHKDIHTSAYYAHEEVGSMLI